MDKYIISRNHLESQMLNFLFFSSSTFKDLEILPHSLDTYILAIVTSKVARCQEWPFNDGYTIFNSGIFVLIEQFATALVFIFVKYESTFQFQLQFTCR